MNRIFNLKIQAQRTALLSKKSEEKPKIEQDAEEVPTLSKLIGKSRGNEFLRVLF